MQLIGQAIRHETFGKGIVTGWNRNILTVCFPGGDKRFLYPDAFARRHLTLRNQEMQAEIQELLLAKEAEKQEAQQAMQEEQERRALLQHMKLSKMSQAAFDVEEGQLNALFSEWVISTGTYISGASKGEPRVPARMKPNSLCLITHRGTNEPETERRILGMCMVREDFIGSCCVDGQIKAHPVYRLTLKKEEQPLFWPYFSEKTARRSWGNASLKYFSTEIAEKILFDLRACWTQPGDGPESGTFYQYFCIVNRLPARDPEETD